MDVHIHKKWNGPPGVRLEISQIMQDAQEVRLTADGVLSEQVGHPLQGPHPSAMNIQRDPNPFRL